MSNAMLYEDYLRMRASKGDLGMCIITQDDALAIADWIEKSRKVRLGKWIKTTHYQCSECETEWDIDPEENGINYCPNCGARMVE